MFLADSHEFVRRGVKAMLESEGDIEVVGEAVTAAAAKEAILALRPDVCILDADLPDGSGVDVCREVRAVAADVKSLVLIADDEGTTVAATSAALLAGATGCVSKQMEGSALVSAVRLVASGYCVVDPTSAVGLIEQAKGSHGPSDGRADLLARLTGRQREILLHITDGLTNRQIAERLRITEGAVKKHVTALLARLGVQHRTQAAVLVLELGVEGRPQRSSGLRGDSSHSAKNADRSRPVCSSIQPR